MIEEQRRIRVRPVVEEAAPASRICASCLWTVTEAPLAFKGGVGPLLS